MNANEIALLAKATQDGSMPFSGIVGRLILNDVMVWIDELEEDACQPITIQHKVYVKT